MRSDLIEDDPAFVEMNKAKAEECSPVKGNVRKARTKQPKRVIQKKDQKTKALTAQGFDEIAAHVVRMLGVRGYFFVELLEEIERVTGNHVGMVVLRAVMRSLFKKRIITHKMKSNQRTWHLNGEEDSTEQHGDIVVRVESHKLYVVVVATAKGGAPRLQKVINEPYPTGEVLKMAKRQAVDGLRKMVPSCR